MVQFKNSLHLFLNGLVSKTVSFSGRQTVQAYFGTRLYSLVPETVSFLVIKQPTEPYSLVRSLSASPDTWDF